MALFSWLVLAFCCSLVIVGIQCTTLVSTPFGNYPSQCVHMGGNGMTIRKTIDGHAIVHPDGQLAKALPFQAECQAWKEAPWEWSLDAKPIDSASADLSSSVKDIKMALEIPSGSEMPNNNQSVFYVMRAGFKQDGNTTAIVGELTWFPTSDKENYRHWSMMFWTLTGDGQLVHGLSQGLYTSNPTLNLTRQEGSNKWVLGSDWGQGGSMTMGVDWPAQLGSVTVALQQRNVKKCQDLPKGTMTFDRFFVDGTTVPAWRVTTPEPSMCNGSFNIMRSTIKISHN